MKKTSLFLAAVIAGFVITAGIAQSEPAPSDRAPACPCGWCNRGQHSSAAGSGCSCGWCTAATAEQRAGCMCARLLNAATVRVTNTTNGVAVEMTSDNPDVVKHLQGWWGAGAGKAAPKHAGEAKGLRGCSCPWCR